MRTLTVLVCTHNRAELLARTLASLNAARRPASWIVRLLVAANACTDATHEALESYSRSPDADALPLIWFAEPTPGKSYALNSAIPRLEGELVAFVDDDHRIDANYLVSICAAADLYPEATIFCGRILPDWDGDEPSWVHDMGPYRIYPLPVPRYDQGAEPMVIDPETGPLPGGGNLFLRVDVFRRVGGFSTDLGPKGHDLGGGEDSAFLLNALKSGERLQYVPDVMQYHYVDLERLRFWYLLRKAYQRSKSVSRVHTEGHGVPLYMWRKLAGYLAAALLLGPWARTRFYLMRVSSALGEIRGFHDAKHRNGASSFAPSSNVFPPLAIAALGVTGLAALASTLPSIGSTIATTVVVTATLALALVTKSLFDFSRTGPEIREEIRAHYRGQSLFAIARLTAYAFVIIALQAATGALLYGAAAHIGGWAVTPHRIAIANLVGIALFTGRQFCRHLLYVPASLVASSHYRMARFYGLWRRLSPKRLFAADALVVTSAAALILASFLKFVLEQAWPGVLGIGALCVAWMTGYLWLRQRDYPTPQRTESAHGRLNVLMLGSDTLRADRIKPDLTPCISRLAQRGTYFERCYVPCARTAPSLISILTGTWPQRHSVRDNFVDDADVRLPVEALPSRLRRHGYATAALSDWCGADMGKFPFGFDYLDLPQDQWNLKFFIRQGPKDLRLFLSLFTRNAFGKTFLPEIYYLGGVPSTDLLGRAGAELINRLATDGRPFFLNMFFSTTHPPFGSEYPYYTRYTDPEYAGESKFAMARLTDPWEIIRRQAEPREAFDLDQIMRLYDGCVRRFDDEVHRIVDHLEHCGLAKNTIVVVYSDHGMEFFEHGTWGQGNSAVSEHSARIPLLIVDPRAESSRRVDEVVRSIDIAPTLLELLGFAPPSDVDGVSLAACVRHGAAVPELDAYNETGIWVNAVPGMSPDHLTYPDLMELLEIPQKATGTLAIKQKYRQQIVVAKDRTLRSGRWKLVYQPHVSGPAIWLFDVEEDPECRREVSQSYPLVVAALWRRLQALITLDDPDPIRPCVGEAVVQGRPASDVGSNAIAS